MDDSGRMGLGSEAEGPATGTPDRAREDAERWVYRLSVGAPLVLPWLLAPLEPFAHASGGVVEWTLELLIATGHPWLATPYAVFAAEGLVLLWDAPVAAWRRAARRVPLLFALWFALAYPLQLAAFGVEIDDPLATAVEMLFLFAPIALLMAGFYAGGVLALAPGLARVWSTWRAGERDAGRG